MSSFISKVGGWSILLLILLVSGCGTSSSTESQASGVQLPDEIVQLRLQDNGSVHAYVEVDGGQKTEMAITGSTAQLQLTLTEGSHNIRVILEYVPSSGSGTPIILADTTKPVNVTASTSTPLAFASSDFDFTAYDDDKDGFSNLSEMQSGDSAPVILTVSPAVSSVDVIPASPVVVSFDDPIDPDTLDTGIIVMGASSGLVDGTVSYIDSTHTASFTPSQALNDGESYTVTIGNAIKNTAGAALSAAVSYSFTINKIPPPPSVLSVTPDNNSVDVAVDTPIIITFNSSMKAITLSDGVTVSDAYSNAVTGSVSYDDSTHIATFTPGQSLNHEETYTVTVATSVQNSNGLALASEFTSSFTVVVAPPMVTSVSPADNSSDIAIDTVISVTFDSSMNAATLPGGMTLRGASSGAVTGAVSYDENTHTATFTPTGALNHSEIYTLTVATSVQNSTGQALASAYTSSFTVVAVPPAPTITSVTPSNNSSGIAVDTDIRVSFDSSINTATLPGGMTLSGASSGTVTGSVSYDENTHTATFTPTGALNHSEIYTLTVANSVQNITGQALASSYTSSFTVVAAPPAPTITSVTPSNNSSNIATDTVIRVSFDSSINAATLPGGMTLSSASSGTVTGSVSYDENTHTATFTPTGTLNNSEIYTLTVATSVQNTTGQALASAYTSSFTVVAAPPTVVSVSPVNNSLNVANNTLIKATFDSLMDASTLTASSFSVTDANSNTVSGSVSYDSASKTATFTPSSPLNYSEVYTARLSTAVQSSESIALTSEQSWSFTITAAPVANIAFTLPQTYLQSSLPNTGTISAYIQVDGATRQAMTLNGSDASTQLTGLTTGSHQFTAILEYALTADPQAPVILAESTKNVSISEGSNNIGFAGSDFDFSLFDGDNDGISNFDEMLSGGTAPLVSSLTPADGANNVVVDTSISVVFDDPMIAATITSSSIVVEDVSISGVVNGSVSYNDATRTAVFNPSQALNYHHSYSIALSTSIQNTASQGLSDTYLSHFTTERPPVLQVGSIATFSTNSSPVLAYNDAGDGIAVWETNDVDNPIKYSFYDSNSQTWSAEAVLAADSNSGSMQLATNGNGFAMVWEQYDGSDNQLMGSFYNGIDWSAPVIIDTGDKSANNPTLASNGTGYAVAWYQSVASDYRILASISTDATSWGPPEVIDNGLLYAKYPKIVSNGSEYAVVWREGSPNRIGVNIYNGSWDISTAILLDDGTSTNSSYGYNITSNGSGFSVVWENGESIFNRTYYPVGSSFQWSPLIELDGSSATAHLEGTSISLDGSEYTIASNGNGYAVIFSRDNGLNFDVYATINSSGDANWSAPVALESETSNITGSPIIVSNGSTYASLWSQYDGSATYDLFSSVYDGSSWSTGQAIDTISTPITEGFSLVGIGAQYVATWPQQLSNITNLYARVYDETPPLNGWLQVQSLELGALNTSFPQVATALDGGVAVGWSQSDAGIYTNTFNTIDWGGEIAVTSSASGGSSYSPKLYSNGNSKTLALWQQNSSGNYNLYSNIHQNNAWGQPQLLFTSSSSISFDATSDGNGFAVTWNGYEAGLWSVFARVYDGNQWGAASEVDDSTLVGSAYHSAGSLPIASNGSGYMLVYSQSDGSSYYDVYARHYDGTSWGSPLVLNSPLYRTFGHATPVIASNGTTYLVVWGAGQGDENRTYSREFDGVSWSAETLLITYLVNLNLGTDGSDYFAAWSENDGTQNRVKGSFYTAGTWGSVQSLDAGTTWHQSFTPIIKSNGQGYLVAWSEYTGTLDTLVSNVFDGTGWTGPVILDDGASGSVFFDTFYKADVVSVSGSDYAITWLRNNGTDVYSAFAGIYNGNWSPTVALETYVGNVYDPAIASDGNGFLAAWIQQDATGIHHVMKRRYDFSSGWSGLSILDEDPDNRAFDLSLASSTGGYLAIWTQAEPTGDPLVRFPWARVGF